MTALATGNGPFFLTSAERSLPSTYSMTRKWTPLASSASWAATMFGWLQLGRRLDLSLKAGHCRRILRHGRRQHLDRHDALHPAMLGLEDLPHAASPDLVEDRVVAQDQRLGPALVDFLGLELRQVLALDQLPGKFFGVFRMGLGRNEVFELAGSNDARICKLLDELFEGDGHRGTQGMEERASIIAAPLMELTESQALSAESVGICRRPNHRHRFGIP